MIVRIGAALRLFVVVINIVSVMNNALASSYHR